MHPQEQLKHMMIELEKTERDGLNRETVFLETCPKCHGCGWEYYKDKEGRDMGRKCSCGALERIVHNRRLLFANIPESFMDVKLENFKKSVYKNPESQEKIIEAAKAVRYWMQNFDKMISLGIGLYFYSGTRGSGKTRLAVSIANELINKYGKQVKFSTSLKILEEIKKTWNNKTSRDNVQDSMEHDLLSSLSAVDILIIDDFGMEHHQNWIDDKFNSIINERYNDKKITIFTSNMSIDDLPYDTRITSRVKERTLQIPFPEESVREFLSQELQQELKRAISQEG